MRRKAFTITELAVAMLIMTTMAAAVALSTNAAKQTAKNEANKIAAVITRLITNADRTHSAFWFIPEDNNLYVVMGRTYSSSAREKLDFKLSNGCSFSSSHARLGYNTEQYAAYSVIDTSTYPSVRVEVSSETKDNAKFKLTVTGEDRSTCYIYVFAEGDN